MMSKNYNFKKRIKFALALLIIFLIILATNLLDKRHFNTAQQALQTVYEDRLVAQHYLFQINAIIYQKQEQFKKGNYDFNTLEQDIELEETLERFASTKLTKRESRYFHLLIQHLKTLQKLEEKFRDSSHNEVITVPKIFDKIKEDINKLAEIQMIEGKMRTQLAKKSLNTTNLLSNLEIGLLIVLGIVIQFVIFYRVKESKKIPGLRIE